MVTAAATSPSTPHLVLSRHRRTLFAFPPSHLCSSSLVTKGLRYAGAAWASKGVWCAAVGTAEAEPDAKSKKTGYYELQALTTWLLRQERDGAIDAKLTILLSSISKAWKQIASLVQRAGIAKVGRNQN